MKPTSGPLTAFSGAARAGSICASAAASIPSHMIGRHHRGDQQVGGQRGQGHPAEVDREQRRGRQGRGDGERAGLGQRCRPAPEPLPDRRREHHQPDHRGEGQLPAHLSRRVRVQRQRHRCRQAEGVHARRRPARQRRDQPGGAHHPGALDRRAGPGERHVQERRARARRRAADAAARPAAPPRPAPASRAGARSSPRRRAGGRARRPGTPPSSPRRSGRRRRAPSRRAAPAPPAASPTARPRCARRRTPSRRARQRRPGDPRWAEPRPRSTPARAPRRRWISSKSSSASSRPRTSSTSPVVAVPGQSRAVGQLQQQRLPADLGPRRPPRPTPARAAARAASRGRRTDVAQRRGQATGVDRRAARVAPPSPRRAPRRPRAPRPAGGRRSRPRRAPPARPATAPTRRRRGPRRARTARGDACAGATTASHSRAGRPHAVTLSRSDAIVASPMPGHLIELLDVREPAVGLAEVEDLLRRDRPDALQGVELLERRRVEVDRAGGRSRGGCLPSVASRHRRRPLRHDDLPPVLHLLREVDLRQVRPPPRPAGPPHRVVHPRARAQPVDARPHHRPRDVHHHPRTTAPPAVARTGPPHRDRPRRSGALLPARRRHLPHAEDQHRDGRQRVRDEVRARQVRHLPHPAATGRHRSTRRCDESAPTRVPDQASPLLSSSDEHNSRLGAACVSPRPRTSSLRGSCS